MEALVVWLFLLVAVVGLGLLGAAVLSSSSKKSSKKELEARDGEPAELHEPTIRDAKPGDVITLKYASREFDDLTFRVEKRQRYEWGRHEWFELVGESNDGRVGVEWEDDDGLWITLTRPDAERSLEDLGITEDDLVRMDEAQDASETVELEGVTYRYEKSHETGFSEDGGRPEEGLYQWSFESEDGKRSLSIEKWEGEAFEAYVGETIDPDNVTIHQKT